MQYEIIESELAYDRESEKSRASPLRDIIGGKLWREHASFLAMVGSLQALFIIPAAMLLYSGGTISNPYASGFSFQGNYLTDLGRLVSYSGSSNLMSSVLFNLSLVILGVFLIPYFFVIPGFFQEIKEAKWFGRVGSVFGLVMTVGFIGTALIPSDVYGPAHQTFGTLAFIFGLPMAILLSSAIIMTPFYPNRYGAPFLALSIIFFGFLVLLLQGSYMENVSSFYATGQNIIIFPKLLCFFLQAYGTWKIQNRMFKKWSA